MAEACGSSPSPSTGSTTQDAGGLVRVDGTAPTNEDGGGTAPGADAGDTGATDSAIPTDAADSGHDAGPGPPLCNQSTTAIGPGTYVIGTSDPDLMGAITPDDLVIAWTSLPAAGPAINWAERASATAPFGPVQTLDSSLGPFPTDKVALSADGLKIAFATPDHTQMVEIGRSKRGQAFTIVATAIDFGGVNGSAGDGTTSLAPFASPALSPDFKIWAFFNGAAGFVISQSQFGAWTSPGYPGGVVFADAGAANIMPTGWSTDHRTLFYYDSLTSAENMAWADPNTFSFSGGVPDLSFFTQVSLGLLPQYAYPSGTCTSLYYSEQSPDAGAADTLDIYVSALQ
jgi:hypothetical protein